MSKLHVLTYPNNRLRHLSKDILEVNQTIQELAQNMFETMVEENGIGLAAPQVGEEIRLIVVDVPKQDPIDSQKYHADPIALINPVIIDSAGETQYDEGCLSCPELIVTVDRAAQIKVAYLDLEGRTCELSADGLKSICIQHEIDHLNGVLLVDKVSRIERDMYKKKRIRIAKDDKEFQDVL